MPQPAARKPGRPSRPEMRQQTRRFLQLLHDGATLEHAAEQAQVSPARALRLLDEPEFFTVYQAIRDGRLGPTAVIVEPGATTREAA
jgi:hypothetical protein